MKKSIQIFSLLLLSTVSLCAQNLKPPKMPVKSQISFDMFGQGAILSLNYDQILHESNKGFLSGRIGVGLPYSGFSLGLFGAENESKGIGFPHSLSWCFGKKHALEVGVGGIFSIVENRKSYVVLPIIGYRFQPQIGHKVTMSFRFYVHPINPDRIGIPFGIGLGFALPGRKR